MVNKSIQMPLPVFLPGNNRDWKEIQGVAQISPEGVINITLQHKEAGLGLFEQFRNGVLLSVSFDYRDPAKEQK